MEQDAIDEAHVRYHQQIEVAATEYQQIEEACVALLARAHEDGFLSVDSAEIIGTIHAFGAASRTYHAALIDAFANLIMQQQDADNEWERMLRRLRMLEQQFKHLLFRLDGLVIEYLRFVEQSTPRVGSTGYVRSAAYSKNLLAFKDGIHPRHLPGAGPPAQEPSSAQPRAHHAQEDAYSNS